MPLDFAAIEQRVGASIRARFRNALVLRASGGLPIEGTFTSTPVESSVGSRGMVARDIGFVCAALDADREGLTEGAELEVSCRGETTRWQVDTRIDDVATGDAVLTLRRPR